MKTPRPISILAFALWGIGCGSGERVDPAADPAVDESKVLVADYYAAHGSLPNSEWLTKQAFLTRLGGTIPLNPKWKFSCEALRNASPTLLVRVSVSAPGMRTNSQNFDLDANSYREGQGKTREKR